MKRIVLGLAGALLLISPAAYATETIAYSYDAKGRLITVARSGSVNSGVTTSYVHDKADNRASLTVTGAQMPFVVVPLNDLMIIPITG